MRVAFIILATATALHICMQTHASILGNFDSNIEIERKNYETIRRDRYINQVKEIDLTKASCAREL